MSNENARNSDANGFAQRLRELRKGRNLSQTELGNLVGVHYTHIGRYERGMCHPTADALKRLADVLGVTGDYLLDGAEDQVAKARLDDRELLRQFSEVARLPDEDKVVIKKLIEAFLVKRQIASLASR